MTKMIKKNTCDYFPHFVTMRNHRKVKVLRNKFGIITGYAFWAIMLEYLTALDGQEMELNDLEVEMFASELGVEVKIAREMIEYSIKIEMLFVMEVKGARFIYSEALNDKLKPVYEKRQHEREKSAARKRRENISAVEILPETHFDPISAADCGRYGVEMRFW